MSITKDGFYNIEGKMFEVVHGVEGDCLILGDEDGGTRISGPKPWGGGQVTKTFVTQEKYGPIERLEEENAKLRKLFYEAWEWMQRARYDRSIRANEMDEIGVKAVKLGFPDYKLGIEADE